MSQELELKLRELDRRLERAESTIELLQNPPPRQWLSPQEAEEYSKGKYTASSILTTLKKAIEHPSDYNLALDRHYIFTTGDGRTYYRINYLEYDRAMVELMRGAI